MTNNNETSNPMISVFDRQERISWWNQNKLSNSNVLVIGAGALGNEVIKNLSLLGIGKMVIADFDVIEDTNLARSVLFRENDAIIGAAKADIAAQRAKNLNPNKTAVSRGLYVDVVWDLGLGVYRHSDVVLGCLDNIEARLSVNLNSWKTGKTWIDGGMWELAGSVGVYNSSLEQACYECSMTPEHYRLAKTRYSCTNSVVKSKIRQGFEPTTQTTSAIVGAIQSQEAIKVLHNLESFSGRKLMFNGMPHYYLEGNNPVYLMDLAVNQDCLCHQEEKIQDVIEMKNASSEMTLSEFMVLLRKRLGHEDIAFDLGCVYVVNSVCPYCGNVSAVNRPKHKVRDVDVVCLSCEITCPTCSHVNKGVPDCENCGQEDIYESRLETFLSISLSSEYFETYKNYKLSNLGIPALQILKVSVSQKKYFVELTSDFPLIWG